MSDTLLKIENLVVAFGAFHAIDGVDLEVPNHEVRFVIGPNGAGKTTLIDAITNLVRPTAGKILFGGENLVGRRDYKIVKAGIGRTFQAASVFDELTVLDNLDNAASFRMSLPMLIRRRKGMSEQIERTLATVGLLDYADYAAGALSHGQKQWLEIAMVLVQEPKLMLLDEPVAGMSESERTRTGELVTEIARTGTTVLVIEHDMDFVRRFAHRVTVMHEGKVLTEGPVEEVQRNETVRDVYLGRPRDARSGAEETEVHA